MSHNSNIANRDATINLFKSQQEHDFFQALRQVFPRFDVYLNVGLSTLIDFGAIKEDLSQEERTFFFRGVVDCVVFDQFQDYKPVYFVELDSAYHDFEEQKLKDTYKDKILAMAGKKLYRIRKNSNEVGVKEFIQMIRDVFEAK